MKVYMIELKLAATAYVRAKSKEEAIVALQDEIGKGCDYSEVEVSDAPLDSLDLPDISLSPVMTVIGPYESWDDMELAD